ncbi:rod shape-determining protein MreC [Rufibacter sp. DG15C]|uniref:rod shape-determining protein MreC n=1 Tax=Rufibacter sp. DG15C TaxID=1379909 RepID=UPI00078EBA28|nr:rod shape-determining protein MreC [Rufibacter sp. DG15C]AMM50378.1 rod shape-determining protein MreC [Rufibacter sp. DG15C]
MRKLFQFIFRIRAFLVFVLFEVLSLYLLYRSNTYHNAAFYQSSNYYVGKVLEFQSEVTEYFQLREQNQTLAAENALLRAQLTQKQELQLNDSIETVRDSTFAAADSVAAALYTFRPARVINNSVRRLNNYLTLNIGSDAGVRAGMGVLTSSGVVGRVKAVSKHYATVTSLLHSQTLISVKLKRNKSFGSIKWDTGNPEFATLHYIPLSEKVFKGDTVVTSGFNAIYPQGITIGRVVSVMKELDKSFYTIRVKLGVDFEKLSYVYVVENKGQAELDTLQVQSGIKAEDE